VRDGFLGAIVKETYSRQPYETWGLANVFDAYIERSSLSFQAPLDVYKADEHISAFNPWNVVGGLFSGLSGYLFQSTNCR